LEWRAVERSIHKVRRLTGVALLGVAVVLTSAVWAQTSNATAKKSSASDSTDLGVIARGKYIVESVAVCSQCHTPHDSQGRPIQSEWLAGGPLWLQPSEPMGDWPQRVPRIGVTPPGTDQEMTMLLTTGIWRDGTRLRPPMPQFRMSIDDAQAVVAYLKSLRRQ